MGIKSTQYITRERAIERIKDICIAAWEHNYREIESMTGESESDNSVEYFVNNFPLLNTKEFNMEKWTDKMLERCIDRPFFRHSMFDNYFIREGSDE